MMDHMQLDLSLVKKEPHYFEDYGHNAGNILDNIIPEPEFDQFAHAAPSVPNAEDMDQGVDWLNSFFDEPSHETCNINGLNPPISKLSDIPMTSSNTYPSVVKLLGQNTHNGTLLETLNLISDEYTNGMVYKSPNSVPSPDPFFGPTQDSRTPPNRTSQEIDLPQALRKAQNFKVLTQIDKNSLNLATARELIQRLKAESQNCIAHRLPEQRLGNVQNHKIHQRSNDANLMSMVKSEPDSNDNDSGYDSPSQPSPGCAPASPSCMLGDKECSNSSADHTPTGDQPQDRQPFYLSEEERRTLITEGLPIPMGYPLSKVEERALKKVRRKIKNKISAQESRRKKKEYMEALEKKLEIVNGDNSDLKKKVETLESTNRTLISQLQKLQAIISAKSPKDSTTRTTQTSQLAMK